MFSYRNIPIQRDSLFKTINNAPNVTDVKWVDYCNGFSRTLRFTVENNAYEIKWWTNESYLKTINDLKIPFKYVEISGTWPNSYKTNLQFYNNGQVVAILPIEKYGE